MASICPHCFGQLDQSAKFCPDCGFGCASYTPALHQLVPGTMLRERYLVGKVLGEGGFGITYVGWDTLFEMKVAIKEFYMAGYVSRMNSYSQMVHVSMGNHAEIFDKNRRRFLDEARVLVRFRNEDGIVGIHDFFQENNTAYIVMDYLEGQTLKAYLKHKGTLSWQETKQLMLPILDSLQRIHAEHIIHRDISPDNIMITNRGKVKLLDFGAARAFSENDIRSLSVILKPGYAPEEQYRTKGQQGPWTDVYALCATMYRCLTGVTPDEAMERLVEDQIRPAAELCDCPAAVSDVLMQGLAVLHKNRFPSAGELMAALIKADSPFSIVHVSQNLPDPDATIYAGRPAVTDSEADVISTNSISENFPSAITTKPKKLGAVFAVGQNDAGQCNVIGWRKNVVAVTSGSFHTVGLCSDGKVLAIGDNECGQCDVVEWSNITAIAAGERHTVGLRSDGTVIAVGKNEEGQCDVANWKDIVSIAAGGQHTIGLRANGTVVAVGSNYEGELNVDHWTNVVAVDVGWHHTVALRADGTVMAIGSNEFEQCEVEYWSSIVAISAGDWHTVALRTDGIVVATGLNDCGQCEVRYWPRLEAIAAGERHTIGLSSDGSVVSVGRNEEGQCNVWDWTGITDIAAGWCHSIGLKRPEQ